MEELAPWPLMERRRSIESELGRAETPPGEDEAAKPRSMKVSLGIPFLDQSALLYVCAFCATSWSRCHNQPDSPNSCPNCLLELSSDFDLRLLPVQVNRPSPGEKWLTLMANHRLEEMNQLARFDTAEEARQLTEEALRQLVRSLAMEWPEAVKIELLQSGDARLKRAWDRNPLNGFVERNDMLNRIVGSDGAIVVPTYAGDACAMTCLGALFLGWVPSEAAS